ncbi:hypothetical protein V1477_002219 [Vespula maculifrons]|uniref:Uncharacterized protein n=1 Tax=Vespula maculifrons TaxID=7453 RepID=A0ABD2CXA8_VESMC
MVELYISSPDLTTLLESIYLTLKNCLQHIFGDEFIPYQDYTPTGQIKRSIMSKKLRWCTYTSDTSKPIIYSTEKVVFVDLQGFKLQNNLFILKEFAICDMTDNLVGNYVFLPPFHEDQLSRKDEIGVRYVN